MPLTPEEQDELTALRDGTTTGATALRRIADFLITALKDNEEQQRLLRLSRSRIQELEDTLASARKFR